MQKQQFCERIFEILSQNIMVVDNSELAENPFLVMKKLEPFLNISSFFVEGRVANVNVRVLLHSMIKQKYGRFIALRTVAVPCSECETNRANSEHRYCSGPKLFGRPGER